MKHYARRVDKNQAAIVAELRAAGVRVTSLASVGSGVPDLICSTPARLLLVEVKNATRVKQGGPGHRKVRARQLAWALNHEGHVLTATTAGEVLAALGLESRTDPA